MSFAGRAGPLHVRTKGATTLPGPDQRAIVFAVGGQIARADVPRLCGSLRRVLEAARVDVVVCDVRALVRPDALTVETLARLQLIAVRRGASVELRNASRELCELIDFMGLRASIGAARSRSRTGDA